MKLNDFFDKSSKPKTPNKIITVVNEIRENERVDIPSKFLTDNKFSAKTTYKLSINKTANSTAAAPEKITKFAFLSFR